MRAKVSLQRFELHSVFETNDIIIMKRFLDWNSRFWLFSLDFHLLAGEPALIHQSGPPCRRRKRKVIHDDAGATRRQPGIPHRKAAGLSDLDASRGKRVIKPAVDTATAAMKPCKAAIGVPQRPQGRRDTFDRGQVIAGRAASRVRQGGIALVVVNEDARRAWG